MNKPKPKPRGRNGGRKPKPGGSDSWLRIRLPAAELAAIEKAARDAQAPSLTAYVRERLR